MRLAAVLFIVLFVISTVAGYGGEEKALKFGGLVQTWFSYADAPDGDDDSPYGFTMRRVRFKPHGSLSETVKWGFQVGWDKQVAVIYDAYMDFHLSKGFKIKVGQFAAPGSVSGALTSSAKLDGVERAAISQNWGGNSGLFGYRAIGVQMYGELADKKVAYYIMLANPRTSSLFTPLIKSPVYTHDNNGLSIWARLEAKPVKGLRIGAFVGSGKTKDGDYKRSSYGGHLFYVKDAINFKAEYIVGEYGEEDAETKYDGMYALLGYRFDKVEPVVRYDFYTPNDGHADGLGVERYKNITVGLNYYYSKAVKFQANYVSKTEDGTSLKNNLFYICFQYTYK